MTATKIKPVSRAFPCPVCGGDHKCAVGADGLILCGRRSGEEVGFVCLGPCEKDATWSVYRRQEDRHFESGHPQNGRAKNGHYAPSVDWDAQAKAFSGSLTAEARSRLANTLGLPEAILETLGVGYSPSGPFWTFPEKDASGKVVGINRRYESGEKKVMAGGHRGLSLPIGWDRGDGPVFLVEGASDTLALVAMGLAVAGRPSNTGGSDHLAELLKTWPIDRAIVVLGENDGRTTDDGKHEWPGRKGAVQTAGDLATRLRRSVLWALPPALAKDVREWATKVRKLDPNLADAWADAGDIFCQELLSASHRIEPKIEPEPSQSETGFVFKPITSTEFAQGDFRPTWLIKGILVAQQPGVMGGPSKALKTGVAEDELISLGSGTAFLGKFTVPHSMRVAFLSGESGQHVIQETANRICKSKGINLSDVNCVWQFDLPQLARQKDMVTLREGIQRLGIKAIAIDPLYLCLLSGQTEVEASNMYQMGPLLLGVAKTCLQAGCTPILLHHTKRAAAKNDGPLELEDLAFAGIAEFARQWLLLNRREPYDPESGVHKLWLKSGGSVGHCGIWGLTIDEGQLDENFQGRTWQVTVEGAKSIKASTLDAKEQKRLEQLAAQEKRDDAALLEALDQLDPNREGVTKNKVRDKAKLPGARVNKAVARLVEDGVIEAFIIKAAGGNGAQIPAGGIRRKSR